MAGKQGQQRHILVINETPAILDLFRDLLREEGYRVSTDTFTAAVETKLTEIKRLKPDLIVLDYTVGGEELGWQMLQLLKMERATAGLPVIVCSGAVRQVEELQGHLKAMGVAVLLKPFELDQIVAEIDRVWDRLGHGT